MTRALLWGATALAAVVLTGCGSMMVADPAARGPVVDQQRVAAVERIAARTGTRVYWINPPTVPAD